MFMSWVPTVSQNALYEKNMAMAAEWRQIALANRADVVARWNWRESLERAWVARVSPFFVSVP